MKLYIAGTFHDPFVESGEAVRVLTERGHTVVSQWHSADVWQPESRQPTAEIRASIAAQNYADIDRADAVVVIPLVGHHLRGAHTEVGYAIGRGKPVYVFGDERSMNTMATHSLVRCIASLADVPPAPDVDAETYVALLRDLTARLRAAKDPLPAATVAVLRGAVDALDDEVENHELAHTAGPLLEEAKVAVAALDPASPFVDLAALALLDDGWDGENAPAPSEDTILAAELVLTALMAQGVTPDDVDADVLGGVSITVWSERGERTAWFSILNGRDTTLTLTGTGNIPPRTFDVTDGELRGAVCRAKDYVDGVERRSADPYIEHTFEAFPEREKLPALLRVTKEWTPPDGCSIGTRIGSIVTVFFTRDGYARLVADPNVLAIEASREGGSR